MLTCEIYLGIGVLHWLPLDLQVGLECGPMKGALIHPAGCVLLEGLSTTQGIFYKVVRRPRHRLQKS